jgi:hypothetical protein
MVDITSTVPVRRIVCFWVAFQESCALHLDYGVRETITVPRSALWGNQVFFDPALYNPAQAVQVDAKTGNVLIGTGDTCNGMVIPGSGWPSNAVGHGVTAAATSAYNGLFHNLPSYYINLNYQFQPRLLYGPTSTDVELSCRDGLRWTPRTAPGAIQRHQPTGRRQCPNQPRCQCQCPAAVQGIRFYPDGNKRFQFCV